MRVVSSSSYQASPIRAPSELAVKSKLNFTGKMKAKICNKPLVLYVLKQEIAQNGLLPWENCMTVTAGAFQLARKKRSNIHLRISCLCANNPNILRTFNIHKLEQSCLFSMFCVSSHLSC